MKLWICDGQAAPGRNGDVSALRRGFTLSAPLRARRPVINFFRY